MPKPLAGPHEEGQHIQARIRGKDWRGAPHWPVPARRDDRPGGKFATRLREETCRSAGFAPRAGEGACPTCVFEGIKSCGATRLAIELGAISADHLEKLEGEDLEALAESNTIATLLPGSVFHLGSSCYAPARRLIERGAAVALATDFNPGTSPTLNMQMILALACSQMKMTPAEAISAATINGAAALGRAAVTGSLEPDKSADLIMLDVGDYREVAYYFGMNLCRMTMRKGQVIWGSAP